MNQDELALLEFLKDIDDLKEVEQYSNQFNIFEVLGVVNTEIRHSNMLAWLLDPNEIHGLGDILIKKLIRLYVEDTDRLEHQPTLFNLLLGDFEDAIVLREWKNIDLVVASEQNKIVVVIENKIWSKESKHQLKKYEGIINREYDNYEKLFIFLTPNGDDASDVKTWHNISYQQIIECLNELIERKEYAINQKVIEFIEQYISILRRHIVGDVELEKICSKIYYKHKRALDLIYEYKPDLLNDISDMLQEDIKNNDTLLLDNCSKSHIRFTTKHLEDVIPTNPTNEKWTASNRMLLFEINNNEKFTGIYLIIGPGEDEERKKIHEIAMSNKNIFKAKKLANKYASIYSQNFYMHNKNIDVTPDVVLKRVKQAFDKFVKHDLKKIEDMIITHYKLND